MSGAASQRGNPATLTTRFLEPTLYTTDAITLSPDGPIVRGRDDIKRLWGSALEEMGLRSVKIETVDLQIANDLAYEVGEAILGLPTGSSAVKFVVVWKRVAGQWHVHREIWNAKAG